MQALELLRHLRSVEDRRGLVGRHGGRLELTCIGWMWRPPTEEAWEAFMDDERPAYLAGLAKLGTAPAAPTPSKPEKTASEPEASPRELRRRRRLANRDKRIIWA